MKILKKEWLSNDMQIDRQRNFCDTEGRLRCFGSEDSAKP